MDIPGYRIERELGRGGMATVYLAEQLSLRRRVALKVLEPRIAAEPGFTERFVREGRIAANLRHRHIVAVHDVGVHQDRAFLAMEYLPRGSIAPLAGELDAAEALRCVREIAGALDAAHRQGIVHRDVKPENILQHDDGAFLLSDFGIARVLGSASVLTREGSAVGTPAYMSPEQWRDDPVDGRSDLYGLGVVLYQLLTGALPYTGSDGWSLGLQHMSAPIPELPERHRAVQPLLAALLAKSADERPATGADTARLVELLERDLDRQAARGTSPPPSRAAARMLRAAPRAGLAALFRTTPPPSRRTRRWLLAGAVVSTLLLATPFAIEVGWRDPIAAPPEGPAPTTPGASGATPMLAVLPCDNWLSDPRQASLGDSLAQQIAHRLSRLDGLSVVGSSSSFALRSAKLTGQEIGRRLGADLLLGCSLRDSHGLLRIGAELTDAHTNTQRWSVQLERTPDAMLDTVDEIAVGIAERVLANLVGNAKAALLVHETDNAEALQAYFDAIRHADSWTAEGFAAAEQEVARALALDPDFALAHFALANLWMNRMQIENLAPRAALPEMERALAQALQRDPELGPAYALRCHARWYRYQWAGARDDCRRAVMLSPNSERVHMLAGQFESSFGDPARGIEHMLRFRELEPEMPFAWLNVAFAYTLVGQHERAMAAVDAMAARFPEDALTPLARGWVLSAAGRCADAASQLLDPRLASNLEWSGWAAGALACAGRRAEAERLRDRVLLAIGEGRYIARGILVYAEAQLGNFDAAFDLIQEGHASHDFSLAQMLGADLAWLAPLRSDPRYAQWRARYDFPARP